MIFIRATTMQGATNIDPTALTNENDALNNATYSFFSQKSVKVKLKCTGCLRVN